MCLLLYECLHRFLRKIYWRFEASHDGDVVVISKYEVSVWDSDFLFALDATD